MENCIFCKIANGKVSSEKIWEDESFTAVLDINPVTTGMTLVIPKKHCSSYIFENEDETIQTAMLAAKKVAKMLENAFNAKKVAVILEGLEVDHLHVKLFPLKDGNSIKSILNSDFPKPSEEELHLLALEIIDKNK